MRKTNYHMHTKRCMHASGTDEEYVLAAIRGGYEEIGFSDHTPWHYDSDFIANMRMLETQFQGYYDSVMALKEKYKDQISIKVGLECEYFPKYMDWLKQLIQSYQLDYVIFGNHYDKTDEDRVYFGTACESDEMLKEYIDLAIEGMKTGLYSYLAHPDLFIRGRRVIDELATSESYRLCKAAKELNVPLEYNLAGAQYNDIMNTMQYPHDEFWKIAGIVGNKGIIGVDAHEPAALLTDKYRDAGIALLKKYNVEIIDTIRFFDYSK